MSKTFRNRLVIGFAFFSIIMMVFSPFGSIDPTHSGFYLSLFLGMIWVSLTLILFSKFDVKNF
jgi:hypothetical protein